MLQCRSFHVDYVDIWFRSHVDFPLRRVGIFRHESSFIPMMAASIRLSLGEEALESIIFEPLSEAEPESKTAVAEIMPAELSSRRNPVWRHIQRIRFYVDEIIFIRLRPELPIEVAGDGMEGDVLWARKSGAEWNRPLWWILWGTSSQEFLDGADDQNRRNRWSLIMKNNAWI